LKVPRLSISVGIKIDISILINKIKKIYILNK